MTEAAPERIAENEVVLREVNERIAEKTSDLEIRGLAGGDETSEYLCSCGRPDCDDMLRLTLTEFAEAHARDDQFSSRTGTTTRRSKRSSPSMTATQLCARSRASSRKTSRTDV